MVYRSSSPTFVDAIMAFAAAADTKLPRLLLLLLLVLPLSLAVTTNPSVADSISTTYYDATCPNASAIIFNKVSQWIARDRTLGPSLIRLHFHDCAVRGCDGSILLNYKGSERQANESKTLRGFQVIDDIKSALEAACPRTVSCADILFVAARDATLLLGGPFWEAQLGRKDGRVWDGSLVKTVPQGVENISQLINFMKSKGLTVLDLVALSGVHTIGRCTCGTDAVQKRLHGHSASAQMYAPLLRSLRLQCQRRGPDSMLNLDNTTPTTFDNVYYTNLLQRKSLLLTDQRLLDDPRTRSFAQMFADNPDMFSQQFANSMINLGFVQILTGNQGEVHTNCNFVNPK